MIEVVKPFLPFVVIDHFPRHTHHLILVELRQFGDDVLDAVALAPYLADDLGDAAVFFAVRVALWLLSLRLALTEGPNVGLLFFGIGLAAGMARAP